MKNFHVKRNVRWVVTALALVITGCAEGGSPTGGSDADGDGGDFSDPSRGALVATMAVNVSLMGFAPPNIIVASPKISVLSNECVG